MRISAKDEIRKKCLTINLHLSIEEIALRLMPKQEVIKVIFLLQTHDFLFSFFSLFFFFLLLSYIFLLFSSF